VVSPCRLGRERRRSYGRRLLAKLLVPAVVGVLSQLAWAQNAPPQLHIRLVWSGAEDLDLSVKCPGGELNFTANNACGGNLDIDSNKAVPGRYPEENALWLSPPAGHYEVRVTLYNRRGQPAREVPFAVALKRAGQEDNNASVSAEGKSVSVYSFTIP
jgi:hypothetical protein